MLIELLQVFGVISAVAAWLFVLILMASWWMSCWLVSSFDSNWWKTWAIGLGAFLCFAIPLSLILTYIHANMHGSGWECVPIIIPIIQ